MQLAQSRTAGIWRIKRAKIVLGILSGQSVEKLVLAVRVPPESIINCTNRFAHMGMKYFEIPERKPTKREQGVERMLAFLEDPPGARSALWKNLRVRYIGHHFSARHIKKIRDLIVSYPRTTQSELAKKVSMMFDLYQSNGKLKFSQTAHILRRMEMDNLVKLPSTNKPPSSSSQSKSRKTLRFHAPKRKIALSRVDIERLQFVPVLNLQDSLLWRELIERYHYINTTRLFGAQMRYLVYGGVGVPDTVRPVKEKKKLLPSWTKKIMQEPRGEHLLAALGFAASAWRLESRDRFIGWNENQRVTNLKLIVNNVRFLILPWIRSPNLASRILGGVARRLPFDWEVRYHYRPVLLETFVMMDRFKGTCYRASNWVKVGQTEGYSYYHSYKKQSVSKAIYVYPLCKNFRQRLCEQRSRVERTRPGNATPVQGL